MEKIKKILIFLIISIFLICIILFYIINKDKKLQEESLPEAEVTYPQESRYVENYPTFYLVEQCVNKYIINFNKADVKFLESEEELESIKKSTVKEINAILERGNLTDEELNELLNVEYENNSYFAAREIMELEDEYLNIYSVKGKVYNSIDGAQSEELYFRVRVDSKNLTFSVEPLINKYDKIEDVELNKENKEILNKIYNEYNYYFRKTDEDIARAYFSDFKNLLLNDEEIAYNFLNENYRIKRFPTLESFKEYIKQNYNKIFMMKMTAYSVNDDECIVKNQYSENFTFKMKRPLIYEAIMDDYTLESDEDKEYYADLDENKKVLYNVQKFVKMINSKDYISIYKHLEPTYRENNFNDIETLKKYINKNFDSTYEIAKSEKNSQGSNYIFDIQLNSLETNKNSIEFKIIIQLNDEDDFYVAFVQ